MKYIFYILYRYYISGRWEYTPFFRAACLFGAIIFLNLFALAFATGAPKYIAANYSDRNLLPIICISGYITIITMLYVFVKEKDMSRPGYCKRYKVSHGWFMLLYILFSFVLFGTVVMSELNLNFKKNEYPQDIIIFDEVKEIKE
ncbi:hypothetical protein [Flavobacterium sp.]